MDGIVIIDRYWPILVIRVPDKLELVHVERHIADIGRIYERESRFATLVCARHQGSFPSAATRHALADWQNATRETIARLNVGTATIAPSTLVRGAMRALYWIFRPPNTQVIVNTPEEAFAFCLAQLRDAGVPFGPELTARLEDGTPLGTDDLERLIATVMPSPLCTGSQPL